MKGAKNRTRDEYSVSEQITQLYNLINHRGSLFFSPFSVFTHMWYACILAHVCGSTCVWTLGTSLTALALYSLRQGLSIELRVYQMLVLLTSLFWDHLSLPSLSEMYM